MYSHIIYEPRWTDCYGATTEDAVLVRPDGHVAWCAGAAPDAAGPASVMATLRP